MATTKRVRWTPVDGGYREGAGWEATCDGAALVVTGAVCGDGEWCAAVRVGDWECESWHATPAAAKRAAVALARRLAG